MLAAAVPALPKISLSFRCFANKGNLLAGEKKPKGED